jgi:transposase InsO family protein
MEEKQREAVALFRYGVIGSLISGELFHGDLKRRIRELATRRFVIPFSRRARIGAGTIMVWLMLFRTGGFDALKPKARRDKGGHPSIRKELGEELIAIKKATPKISVKSMFTHLVRHGKMTPNEISVAAAYRFLKDNGCRFRALPKTGNVQRRYAYRFPNDCWQGDAMHGPYINDPSSPKKKRKTYLIAFIDDASRLVVGGEFFFSEATVNVKTVLRGAVLAYGVPRRLYLDNGRNFSADDLTAACASMHCALIHATPYYPQGKGKIERFYKTVQSMFLTGVNFNAVHSLNDLNHAFDAWLQNEYNRRPHDGIDGEKPLELFLRGIESRLRKLPPHVDPADLFCLKETRLVAKDGTFRINNVLYETQEHLIGRKITLRHDRDDPARKVKVYDGDSFVHVAFPIDFNDNARMKRKPLPPRDDDGSQQPTPF